MKQLDENQLSENQANDNLVSGEELEELSGGVDCIIHYSCICNEKSGFADEDEGDDVVF